MATSPTPPSPTGDIAAPVWPGDRPGPARMRAARGALGLLLTLGMVLGMLTLPVGGAHAASTTDTSSSSPSVLGTVPASDAQGYGSASRTSLHGCSPTSRR